MRGKVGTLIRDEMNRPYVLHCYRLKEHHESWKVKVWQKETNIFSLPRSKDWFKIFEISFFQTLISFFCYLLTFVKKVLKANIYAFTKTIFLTPSLTLTNMSNMFFYPFHPFLLQLFKTNFFRDSWGVNTALSKIIRIFCEKLRRNKLPKLTTFSYFFQLPHSAMLSIFRTLWRSVSTPTQSSSLLGAPCGSRRWMTRQWTTLTSSGRLASKGWAK